MVRRFQFFFILDIISGTFQQVMLYTCYHCSKKVKKKYFLSHCIIYLLFFGNKLKDITTRVIAMELKLDETPVSKVMTRNPVFVLSDTLAVEALQKMVQGLYIT
jgi:CBS domain-containing protein